MANQFQKRDPDGLTQIWASLRNNVATHAHDVTSTKENASELMTNNMFTSSICPSYCQLQPPRDAWPSRHL
jgi:hypothetical protein